MTEFMFMAFVAFIILFVAIQMAALGREAMALGQLNYQVTRWATAPGNNSLKDAAVTRSTVPSAPTWRISLTARPLRTHIRRFPPWRPGIMGKIGYGAGHTVCGNPPAGGIGVAMNCVAAGGTPNTLRRAKAGRHGSADHL